MPRLFNRWNESCNVPIRLLEEPTLKAVILAGGKGTRISEESHLRPKPMIEIGGMPLLWHIMKGYSYHGINEFIICCGYKGYIIKEYFANYLLHMSDVTIDLVSSTLQTHRNMAEPWSVTLVDTGMEVGTGGRLKRIAQYLDGPFCMTYGDGVSDVDIKKLVEFHQTSKNLATVTGIPPAAKFGVMSTQGNLVINFEEKPENDPSGWINGGFFVLEPEIIEYIDTDETFFEREPLKRLASEKKLGVLKHPGFWMCMDTLRDRNSLEKMWSDESAPWKIW